MIVYDPMKYEKGGLHEELLQIVQFQVYFEF